MNHKVAVFVFLIVWISAIHLLINQQTISVGYENNSLNKELSELRNKNREVAAEASKLSKFDRIESIAKNSLNMKYPEKVSFIIATVEGN